MKLKFHEKISGAQMMFHAQKEKSMKPANKQLLDKEILMLLVKTITIVFLVGFASIQNYILMSARLNVCFRGLF
jgi:hypothetical protein